MIVLYILLGLLVFLGLLLLCDLRIIFVYDQEFSYRLAFLFLRYPFKHQKEKRPVTKAERVKEPPSGQKEPSIKFEYVLRVLREFVSFLGRLREHIRIHPCRLRITVAEEDAAETAVAYGRYCALAGALEALLKGSFKKVESDFSVRWEFEPQQPGTRVELRMILRLRLFYLIKAQFWKPVMLLAELQQNDEDSQQPSAPSGAENREPAHKN